MIFALFVYICKIIQTNSFKGLIIVKKTYFDIILLLTGILFSASLYSANSTTERLSKLQSLFNNNIIYSQEVTNDSIILWEKQLAPLLEQNKQYETLFELKQMVVCAYASRGDMSMAIDHARIMYDKAKSMNYEIGIALSSRAIGDAYMNANMPKEGIEAYEESLQLFSKKENTENHRIKVLPKLIMALVKMREFQKADNYLKQLEATFIRRPSESLQFYMLICRAYYYVQTGKPTMAEPLLTKAQSICNKLGDKYFQSINSYMLAIYYQTIGDYDKALAQFQLILTENSIDQSASKLIQLYEEQANLLTKMGRIDEACLIYQRAIQKKDSMNIISYSRQINDLRTTYRIDQIEIQSQIQQNQTILWTIIGIFFVLILIALLIVHIKIGNRRLRRSKAKLEEARRYAENSIKTKSIFLSNMSHEIRTPLNALSGFSSILTDSSIDSKTRQQCNDIIQQNSELLLKLINDVIDLSSLEVGKLTFNFRECDAVTICRNVVDTVEKVKQTSASVIFKTSLESLTLLTDDSRLQQVLINLLINATKFTTQGTITLELSKESETTARFTVTDTGCGIPLEKQSTIFNRFEKLNEGAQGTGLGLSICQLIIEQIGGSIGIDPKYTEGTRFVFTHPLQPNIRKEEAI